MKKSGLLNNIAKQVAEERFWARVQAVQLSEDIALKAAYVVFGCTPEDLNKLRAAIREEYDEWCDKIDKDYKYDKQLWYSDEVHERELRSILGEYYEEKEQRYRK